MTEYSDLLRSISLDIEPCSNEQEAHIDDNRCKYINNKYIHRIDTIRYIGEYCYFNVGINKHNMDAISDIQCSIDGIKLHSELYIADTKVEHKMMNSSENTTWNLVESIPTIAFQYNDMSLNVRIEKDGPMLDRIMGSGKVELTFRQLLFSTHIRTKLAQACIIYQVPSDCLEAPGQCIIFSGGMSHVNKIEKTQ